jgi:hypothetical protein
MRPRRDWRTGCRRRLNTDPQWVSFRSAATGWPPAVQPGTPFCYPGLPRTAKAPRSEPINPAPSAPPWRLGRSRARRQKRERSGFDRGQPRPLGLCHWRRAALSPYRASERGNRPAPQHLSHACRGVLNKHRTQSALPRRTPLLCRMPSAKLPGLSRLADVTATAADQWVVRA